MTGRAGEAIIWARMEDHKSPISGQLEGKRMESVSCSAHC